MLGRLHPIVFNKELKKLKEEDPTVSFELNEIVWPFEVAWIDEQKVTIKSTERSISLALWNSGYYPFDWKVGQDIDLADAEKLRTGQQFPLTIWINKFFLDWPAGPRDKCRWRLLAPQMPQEVVLSPGEMFRLHVDRPRE